MAFRKHFDKLSKCYNQKRIVVINLVEECGKESMLADAYLENIKYLDQNNLLYIQFDFHEHWFVEKLRKKNEFDENSILILFNFDHDKKVRA